MSDLVYPSLPPDSIATVLDELQGVSLAELASRTSTSHARQQHPATGQLAGPDRISEVGSLLRALAGNHGYPESASQSGHIAFDQAAAGQLHRLMEAVPWSAADRGVWAFFTLVVAPGVAAWRYPDRNADRLGDGPRNAFGRLWWRAELLGSGPDDPPALLGEDQLVAVMERSDAIGGEPAVARALCHAVLRGQETATDLSPMILMRESAKRVTRLTSYRLLGALDEVELTELMRSVVSIVIEALRDGDRDAGTTVPPAVEPKRQEISEIRHPVAAGEKARRDIGDVPQEELRVAIDEALSSDAWMDRNQVLHQAVKRLGFERLAKRIRRRLNRAIGAEIRARRIESNNGGSELRRRTD